MNQVMYTIPNVVTTFAGFDMYSYATASIPTNSSAAVYLSDDQTMKVDENTVGRYSTYDIANWFLNKEPMTHKKLQKLCYYAQAWCFALKGYRLEDTEFEAWVHGPVSPILWNRFKCFGFETIKLMNRVDVEIEEEDEKLLEDVWDTYGANTGNSLEALSHRELPWIEARKGYKPDEKCSVVISPSKMASYYKSIYSRD
jgi:uncharacterized phage-associated protein